MSAANSHQFKFADGLRGIAALQVVFSHYASVFLPLFGHSTPIQHFAVEKWLSTSPFLFLIDGGTAVAVFFVISGFVLSRSFSASEAPVGALAIKRFARLFLPVAIACVVSWVMFAVAPEMRDALRAATGTGTMGDGYEITYTLGAFAYETLLGSMAFGYHGVSLFDEVRALQLAPMVASVNPPFWTLHFELWGSMLVLALTWLRKHTRGWLFALSLAGALWATGTSSYLLFVVGFLLERVVRSRALPTGVVAMIVGGLLIVAGEFVGVTKGEGHVNGLFLWASQYTLGKAFNPFVFQSTVAGIAIFAGVLLCAPVRRVLSAGWALSLGRLSFGMYLFHFPVLVLVGGAAFFLTTPWGYGLAVTVAFAGGLATSVWLAHYFDLRIDSWAIGKAKLAGDFASRILAPSSKGSSELPLLPRERASWWADD